MSQTFTGGNCLNNEFVVDYAKREVTFKPLGSKSLWATYMQFSMNLHCLAMIRILVPFWAIYTLFFFVISWLGASGEAILDIIRVMIVLSPLPFIWSFSYSLFFWDDEWRERHFPEHNYSFSKLSGEEQFLTVSKDAVIDKRFLLPFFENVGLQYEASGDFSFYLEKIEVRSHFTTDDGSWFALFTFSEQPVEGELKIRYV